MQFTYVIFGGNEEGTQRLLVEDLFGMLVNFYSEECNHEKLSFLRVFFGKSVSFPIIFHNVYHILISYYDYVS